MVALTAMRGLGPLLALAALFSLLTQAAADVVDLPDCPAHVVLFRFDSIRWQENVTESILGDSFVMQVMATTTCDDSFPSHELSLLDVAMVYTSASQTLVNVVGYGSIDRPKLTFYFPIDISTINFTAPVYYAVSATFDSKTSTANEWERDTMKEWQPIQMNGAAKVALEVMPGVIEAHHLQPLNLTRLSHTGNLDLVSCTLGKDEVEDACYFMTAEQGDKDVCINQTLDGTDGGGVLLVCDDTVQFVTVSETTNLDSVYLLYPNGVVDVIHTNKATTLELYHYNGTYKACDESPRCNLTSFVPSYETYTFRMVELDGRGSPTSSREVIVQDFNVTTLGISSDTAQVSWDSGTGGEFNVTISPAPDKKFSGRVVNCTEAPCDFFFIGLEEDWTSYKTTVRRVIGDSFTSEVVTSLAAPPNNTISNKQITTLHHHYAVDKDVIIQTEACFEYDSNELSSARLLLIDSTGLAVQSTESGLNYNNITYCFKSVEVPGEFNTSGQTRILVNYENGKKETFSTQTDIFLFTPDFQQVSNTAARATWKNLNSAEFFTSRVPGHEGHEEQQLECSYTGDRCHYYVTEDETGKGEFSLLEVSDKLNQSSTVQLNMIEITKGIDIVTPFSIRQDDLLQVCFEAVPDAVRYELGIELLGELVSSNQDAQTEMVSGKTCAVSSKPVTLGAYEEVWAVVVAYNAGSEILRAGEKNYSETFLSPNRFVLAVTSGSISPVSLKASWYILDDTTSFDMYTVNLVDKNGVAYSKSVVIGTTTFDFSIANEGQHSVCVSATGPSHSESAQTCSDIITVKFSTESPPVPMVVNVKHFYTIEKKLKVSWDRPEDASALLVSWNEFKPKHSARKGRSLRSIETARNQAFTSRKTDVRKSSDVMPFSSQKADGPLSQARSLQNINDQNRKVVISETAGNGFTLVPASQSSLDIPLAEGTWNICVSAVKNHHAGTDFCLSAAIPDSNSWVNPPPPTDLILTDDGELSWASPPEDSYTYYIEFDRSSESRSYTTNITTLPVIGVVEAGEWRVSVHSVYNERISEGLAITIVVDGIEVTYEQTGNRNVTLSWKETSDSDEDNELTYSVTLVGEEPVNTKCSRAKGCSVTFGDVQAADSERINVTVQSQNNQGMKKELQIYFLDIKNVEASKLYRTINANNSITVTWACLEEVSFYNISLVDKNDVVLMNRHKIVPCWYTFAETMTTLQEDSVLIQACLNSPGVERCGDPQRISLGPDVPPGPTTDSSNVLVIVLSSVAAGLLLILMVAGIVYKLRSDRAKRAAAEDASNGGSSVRSLKVDSASQHSVEPPPAGQPTTGLQTNAQNSSQTPVQRQTPVQYRSAAPVLQEQPSNRPIELSINARLNHAAARAPISSVNPNVRYDGSAQTNAASNVGPQRLPQVGNPPPQRYSNPNVRAAGPLRMNVPAGQPRMNNVPSGPANFSGQPRNLTQGARMNRPLNSQPVEVRGRFSGAPIMTRPSQMSPTRAPAPRPTGLQMTASPTRYPPPGQRFAPGPSSATRVQAPPSGLRPIPRVGGGGGNVDMSPSAPGLRPTRSDGRQFSPERVVRQPQPQNPRGPVRSHPDTNRPNYNERIF